MTKLCSLVLLRAVGGCLEGDGVTTPVDEAVPFFGAPQFSHIPPGPPPRPQTWVDGELFNGVVTPAHFDPASDPFDQLYTCGGNGMFLDDVPLISDSKPGDQDYNGGRWHLNVFVDGDSCDGTADGDGASSFNVADYVSTDVYFECPLLPVRRRN